MVPALAELTNIDKGYRSSLEKYRDEQMGEKKDAHKPFENI